MKRCGLYRTTAALGALPAGQLVYFHNHSDESPPIVLPPTTNRHNRWSFSKQGHLISDDSELDKLEQLKPEGLYRVPEHFHVDAERIVAKNSIVQLGYNREADAIVFFPRFDREANALVFPGRGMKVSAAIYQQLEELQTSGPKAARRLH